MARIMYIRPGSVKNRIVLGINDGGSDRTYSVPIPLYESLGSPMRYAELCDDEMAEVRTADEGFRAMRRAVSILAASDKSERMLINALCSKHGFSRDVATNVAQECVRLGYIEESRQLERLVEREANISLRGSLAIKRKLASKGYPPDKIDQAIDQLTESGDVDFSENLERLARKKGAQTDEEKNALRYKYGYAGEDT